jgi:ABC-type methionine transport system ATPase subunit
VPQIGEKDITLSGGQKQRVALARAVYSSSRVVLLDDCLSAVDSPTARHIFEHCLTSDLMHGRTCVLVTHHVGLTLAKADFVVVLKDGQIVGNGTPKQVQSMALVADILAHTKDNPEEETRPGAEPDTSLHKAEGSGVLTVEEERKIGQVKWPVYLYFADATGGVAFWMAAIGMMIASQAVYIAQIYWIRI